MPSHGSLSKAGKVRSMTPTIESRKNGSSGPRVSNRSSYYKRITLGRNQGGYGSRRRRR